MKEIIKKRLSSSVRSNKAVDLGWGKESGVHKGKLTSSHVSRGKKKGGDSTKFVEMRKTHADGSIRGTRRHSQFGEEWAAKGTNGSKKKVLRWK